MRLPSRPGGQRTIRLCFAETFSRACPAWRHSKTAFVRSRQYYQQRRGFYGSPPNIQDSYRLFMTPGMDHCGGGDGPNTFDSIHAITQSKNGSMRERLLTVSSRRTSGTAKRNGLDRCVPTQRWRRTQEPEVRTMPQTSRARSRNNGCGHLD
jgi:hypothetical protein